MKLKQLIKRATPAPVWAKLFKLRHEVIGGYLRRGHVRAVLRDLGWPTGPLGGPFVGMRCLEQATGSMFFPKIVGTYELEVHQAVEWIIDRRPDVVINVGCAEGYYAVGLAGRLPGTRVIAFDIERRARRLTRKLAALNGVGDRINIQRRCTQGNLEPLCAGARRPALIVDCEGFEDALLVPERVPSLARTTMLVEVHDCFVPGTSARLRDRFGATHEIRHFAARPRVLEDLPAHCDLDDATSWEVMNEDRSDGSNDWLLMVPWAEVTPQPTSRESSPARLIEVPDRAPAAVEMSEPLG